MSLCPDKSNRTELILKVTFTTVDFPDKIFIKVFQEVEVTQQHFENDILSEVEVLHKGGRHEYKGGASISAEPAEVLASILIDFRNELKKHKSGTLRKTQINVFNQADKS